MSYEQLNQLLELVGVLKYAEEQRDWDLVDKAMRGLAALAACWVPPGL